ncbi:MAG: tetratricopeptide repeat protein, partial [Myxococcales bacterium]|nr:tetratricopeptide repeat protein [Myxococcales bacterium]
GGAARYGENAQLAYEEALLDFRDGSCVEAEPVFSRIRREFPYSRYAALAELRLADCKFQAGAYAEAIQAYRQFVRFRPSHDQISYARFRIAAAYFEQIPSDWLLAPPSHERDQAPARDALRQLRRFVLDYPQDARIGEANQMVMRTLRLLARHELYVARFYMGRGAYRGTIGRLRTLLLSYEGSGLEPEALLLLARAHRELGDRDDAREALAELIQRFPESEEAAEAGSLLRELGPAPAPE